MSSHHFKITGTELKEENKEKMPGNTIIFAQKKMNQTTFSLPKLTLTAAQEGVRESCHARAAGIGVMCGIGLLSSSRRRRRDCGHLSVARTADLVHPLPPSQRSPVHIWTRVAIWMGRTGYAHSPYPGMAMTP